MRMLNMLVLALGAATVPVSAQTLGDLAGVQFVGNVRNDVQLQAALLLGVRNVRLAVRWYEVEQANGAYNWALSDSRIMPILRSGLRPIITIFGSNGRYLPTMPGGRNNLANDAVALAAFSRFAGDVVTHYGVRTADGRPIIYEIWNEPNTRTFWGSPPNPEDYATLATSACRAIKALRPQAVVVGLAMEGTPVKAPYFVPAYNIDIYRQWAARAYTPSLTACVDGISMHPYRSVPETYLEDEKAFTAFLASAWSKKSPPIVVNSEWGGASGRGASQDADGEQAAQDLRILLIGAGSGRLTSLYQVMDAGANIADANNRFGLFQYNGGMKAAGRAISMLLQKIGKYDIDGVGEVPGRKGVYAFRCHSVEGPSRFKAMVVWNLGKAGPVDLPISGFGTSPLGISLVDGTIVSIRGAVTSLSSTPVLIMEH